MSDDLGRGQVGWGADRWTELDTMAADATTASVVMRNLVEHKEQPDARTARIAGVDIGVGPLEVDFAYNMQNEDATDLERHVRLAAQDLADIEDQAVIAAMNIQNPQASPNLQSAQFIRAKNALRGQGVQQGFGVVVSADALTALESEAAGVRSGLELVERLVGTTVAQTNALDGAAPGNLHAVLFQASPAAFRLVHAYGPRLRVVSVQGGNVVNLRLEEGIAVGQVTPNRCLGIRLQQQHGKPARQAR
jgi:uncharacterized linocin/CFP29 family protein